MKRLSYEQALEQNGYFASPPVGTSMLPLLRQNEDVAVIRSCKTVRFLDVILFRRPNGQAVLHRVVGRRGGALLLRGDNQMKSERVSTEQVVGVLDAFYRRGKRHDARSFRIRLYGLIWWLIFPARYVWKHVTAIPYYLRRARNNRTDVANEK